MTSPARLAHFVLRTSDIDGLADWYCKVLDAKVVHRNKMIAFATFDDEHHRIAFLDRGFEKGPDPEGNGVDHCKDSSQHHSKSEESHSQHEFILDEVQH